MAQKERKSPGYSFGRNQVQEAKPKPGATLKALKQGPHGSVTTANGKKDSAPNPHAPTSGGKK